MKEERTQDNIINRFMNNKITSEEINFAGWVLNSVYGWKIEKIRKFKISTLTMWLKRAEKRLTVKDMIYINTYFNKPKERKTLWEKLKN